MMMKTDSPSAMRLTEPCRYRSVSAALLIASTMLLAACSSPGPGKSGGASSASGGGYYLDDGPGGKPPVDPLSVPDAVPRSEPLNRPTMRPYVALGRRYEPMTELVPYKARGVASWYGSRYHGRKTANGEVYDMYAMSGAHPTLPIPSYVRVTNLKNGRTVIVRINDRGPFLNERLIDLSYTAATRLDYLRAGSALVEVELITQFDGPATPNLADAGRGAGAGVGVSVGGDTGAREGKPLVTPLGNSGLVSQGTITPGVAVIEPAATSTPALGLAQPPLSVSMSSGASDPAGRAASATASATTSVPPAAPAPATTAPSTADGSLYLQLAAYTSRSAADAAAQRFARALSLSADQLLVRQEGSLYKIHAGPYAGRAQAMGAAQQIEQRLSIRPFTVSR
jgi:rare lipoprotein A